jgi:hypothetical protein
MEGLSRELEHGGMGEDYRNQDFAAKWNQAIGLINLRRTALQEGRVWVAPIFVVGAWILHRLHWL